MEAWQVPVRDDVSVDDEHPPYGQDEQMTPGEEPVRHTAGGDMLRRTANAALNEAGGQSPVIGTRNPDNSPGETAASSNTKAAQGSPDRCSILTAGLNQLNQATSQLQILRLDQPESYMYGLRVGVGPAEVDLSRLASGDAELFEGQEQDLSGAFPEGTARVEGLLVLLVRPYVVLKQMLDWQFNK